LRGLVSIGASFVRTIACIFSAMVFIISLSHLCL
jgi:hypothetical protein